MPYFRELHLILTSALTTFKRNKVRTFLTSLGILIGVLSVVMLIALGLGLKNYIHEQFENLGTNLIAVMPGSSIGGEGGLQSMGASMIGGIKFDLDDVDALNEIPTLEYVAPVFYKYASVSFRQDSELGYILGSHPDSFKLLNLKLIAGKPYTLSHLRAKDNVCVLGYSLAEKLFPSPDRAIGKTISISDDHYQVLGVAEKKGDPDTDNGVHLPFTSTFKSLNPTKDFFAIYTGVTQEKDISSAKTAIKKALLKNYDEDEFSVTESSEILSAVGQIFAMINAVLIAIGSISLVVGGIGIMNIMYASVTERTKEIGIRRAIGATQTDILKQFLSESVILSVFGGLMGLLLSTLIVLLIRPFFPLGLNLTAILVAFGVSAAIGIFFGVFPARKAAKLPPIQAIRYE